MPKSDEPAATSVHPDPTLVLSPRPTRVRADRRDGQELCLIHAAYIEIEMNAFPPPPSDFLPVSSRQRVINSEIDTGILWPTSLAPTAFVFPILIPLQ